MKKLSLLLLAGLFGFAMIQCDPQTEEVPPEEETTEEGQSLEGAAEDAVNELKDKATEEAKKAIDKGAEEASKQIDDAAKKLPSGL